MLIVLNWLTSLPLIWKQQIHLRGTLVLASAFIASMVADFNSRAQCNQPSATVPPVSAGSNSAPPNIVFIFSDDHAYQAISAYDSKINQTPNIDRLANAGMRFDRCLVTNSICGPSRATILTGKYSHLNGFFQNGNQFDGTQLTFPKMLQAAGYQTALFGKWHLASEPTGFDDWFVLPGQGEYYNPDFLSPTGRIRLAGYCTDIVTDRALNWLDQQRDAQRPFLLMVQHKAPHREWMPGPAHLEMYQDQEIPEPISLFDDYSDRAPVVADQTMTIKEHMRWGWDLKVWSETEKASENYRRFFARLDAEQKAQWDAAYEPENQELLAAELDGENLTRWKYQRYIKDYLRCIASIDDNVGRILDYIDEYDLADNTVVIYASDQGFYLGEHGWYDKRWIFEESLRTPLVIRWPGVVEPESVNSNIVSNLDFAQTILEIAGASGSEEMQGRSLVPLLKQEQVDWRDAFYYHYYELGTHNVAAHEGVVTDRYKLIHYYAELKNGQPRNLEDWNLMDRERDPYELKSYHDDPEYLEIRAELSHELQRLRELYQVPSNRVFE